MMERLVNWLALTPTERRVIMFLTATLILGAAIRFYQEMVPSNRQFDYHALDSTFAVFQSRLHPIRAGKRVTMDLGSSTSTRPRRPS